jgi:hypothetical protein
MTAGGMDCRAALAMTNTGRHCEERQRRGNPLVSDHLQNHGFLDEGQQHRIAQANVAGSGYCDFHGVVLVIAANSLAKSALAGAIAKSWLAY